MGVAMEFCSRLVEGASWVHTCSLVLATLLERPATQEIGSPLCRPELLNQAEVTSLCHPSRLDFPCGRIGYLKNR